LSGYAAPGAEREAAPEPFYSPLLRIEKVKALPCAASAWPAGLDACVLPSSLFLAAGAGAIPVPAIVFGGAESALHCLEAGAFDFMHEDWTELELEARIYRFWQPSIVGERGSLTLRGLTLQRRARDPGAPVKSVVLSPMEARALRLLLASPGRVVARRMLSFEPGGERAESKAVAMRISRLKAALSSLEPGIGERIVAVRGSGYLWKIR
jgi:DNA-binding response OmpR family regulator